MAARSVAAGLAVAAWKYITAAAVVASQVRSGRQNVAACQTSHEDDDGAMNAAATNAALDGMASELLASRAPFSTLHPGRGGQTEDTMKTAVNLDLSRLLGFRLDGVAAMGTKIGTKIGVKS